MAASLAIALRNLFAVLGCLITAIVIYIVATDGFPFRIELLTTWMAATLIDFYIHMFVIGSWVVYKESNWITAVLWVVLLVCLGRRPCCHCPSQSSINIMHKCLSVCDNIFRDGENILFTPFTALLHVATSYCSFLSFQLRNLYRIQFTLSCYNVRENAEAITFLLRFIAGEVMNDCGFITTHVDTYSKQLDPWDIYSQGVPCGNDDGENDCGQYRYFITKLKKKSESRYSRNVGNKGSWKQNLSKPVRKNRGPVIGYKKSMSYVNKGYDRQKGHWLMKEYDLSTKILDEFDNDRRDYVFCAIKKRTPTKDSKKLVNTERMNILEHQTPVTVESTSYEGGDMEYMPSSNSEGTNLEHQTSAAVLEFTSFHEALQGGVVVDAGELELQRNSLDLLDFDYAYLPDFDCLQSIITSLDNY